jgi:hypothetical protein
LQTVLLTGLASCEPWPLEAVDRLALLACRVQKHCGSVNATRAIGCARAKGTAHCADLYGCPDISG